MKTMRFSHHVAALLICGILAGMLTSCGIICGSQKQDIYIDGPKGARVFINEKYVGDAPCTLVIKRKSRYSLLVDAPGRANYEAKLEPKEDANNPMLLVDKILFYFPYAFDRLFGTAYTHAVIESEKS